VWLPPDSSARLRPEALLLLTLYAATCPAGCCTDLLVAVALPQWCWCHSGSHAGVCTGWGRDDGACVGYQPPGSTVQH
jgi:hypothetical protein